MAHSTHADQEPAESSSSSTTEGTVVIAGTEEKDNPSKEGDLEASRLPPKPTDAAPPKDPDLVTWDSPEDPENPKNWPNKTKWSYTVAVSVFTFISPVSSSMVAPALSSLARDFHIQNQIEVELALSIFLLAYAFGPLFFGPASEIFGRVRLLQISNLWFLAWNLGCGFAKTKAQLYVFRFLAGIGGSAPLAIGGGALSDIWMTEERGKAMGIYSLAPILGPVVGPVAGGFISEKTTWRWVFWSSSALAGAIQAAGLLWLRESYAPTILKRKRERLVKETGNENLHTDTGPSKSLFSTVGGAFARPARLISTQPIVQVIALYNAYLYGVLYLLLATFPDVWDNVYGESPGIGGINYISLAIGSVVGIMVNFRFIDRIYRNLKEKNGGAGRPEYRTPTMFVGSVFVTIGLFWYGWSVQGHVHWIMPNIGVVIYAAGNMACLQGMQTYTVDSYMRFAASALAAAAILRSLAGFGFPLFAPYLYQALGYGWGTSVLAFVSIGIGFPAPFIFWQFGARLRARSKFAIG